MHESSLKLMDRLLDRLPPPSGPDVTVLDVGSFDVNGSYREIVEKRGFRYWGMDSREGPNVDLVQEDIGELLGPYDHIISGQMLEHDPFPHYTVVNMKRLVKEHGWVILIAPRMHNEHKHPIDCWRFLPDGMRSLLEGFEDVDAGMGGRDYRSYHDCWGIGRKPVGYDEKWLIAKRSASE